MTNEADIQMNLKAWHITWKDLIWLFLLIIGFVMHWQAFQTRLNIVENVVNGPPPMDQRVTKLEQAYLDMHDMVKDIHDEFGRK